MPDFHNSFVQFLANNSVTIFIGVAAMLVALLIYRNQKSKKELSFALVFSVPIVSVRPSVADRVKISFDGNEIKEAQLVIITIKNTGNVAVKREDYDEPITVDFPSCKILSSDVLSTKPDDLFCDGESLKTFLTENGSSLTLAKRLLNPNEEIRLSILLEGSKVGPYVRGRIVDGVVIQDNFEKRINRRVMIIMMAVYGVFIVPSVSFLQGLGPKFSLSILFYAFALVGFLTVAVLMGQVISATISTFRNRKSMEETPGKTGTSD